LKEKIRKCFKAIGYDGKGRKKFSGGAVGGNCRTEPTPERRNTVGGSKLWVLRPRATLNLTLLGKRKQRLI